MFAHDDWGSYLNLPSKANPRLPTQVTVGGSLKGVGSLPPAGHERPSELFLAQPTATRGVLPTTRPHPGTIGTPVHTEDKKSPVDLIQADFPRTPSPVYPGVLSTDTLVAASAAAFEQLHRRSGTFGMGALNASLPHQVSCPLTIFPATYFLFFENISRSY